MKKIDTLESGMSNMLEIAFGEDDKSPKQNMVLDDVKYLEEVSDYIKTNMSLDGFSTTKDLDLQLEGILKSIEPDVMKAVEKIMPKSH